MAIATAVTRLLGIAHPIVLAPMGGVSGGRLAAAVTAAGGGLAARGRAYLVSVSNWRREASPAGACN